MAKKIVLAGGCFWCVEHDLKEVPGVVSVMSGYSGGQEPNPTYYDHKDHREAVEVVYDANKTNFKKIVQFFLDHIDPTDAGGQFYDRGDAYKTGIFFSTQEEQNIATALIQELEESHVYDKPIAVEVLPATQFYEAEELHLQYAEKNPVHYAAYRRGSGREAMVEKTCVIREEKHINWKD